MQALTDHFSLEEFVASQSAARLGIDNTPTPAVLAELKRTAELLEVVRARLEAPILVSSGYRSPLVNAAVGGVAGSAHMFGRAADFICPGFGSPLEVCVALSTLPGLEFDQLIHEFGSWTHIAVAAVGIAPRRQLLTIDGSGTRFGF